MDNFTGPFTKEFTLTRDVTSIRLRRFEDGTVRLECIGRSERGARKVDILATAIPMSTKQTQPLPQPSALPYWQRKTDVKSPGPNQQLTDNLWGLSNPNEPPPVMALPEEQTDPDVRKLWAELKHHANVLRIPPWVAMRVAAAQWISSIRRQG